MKPWAVWRLDGPDGRQIECIAEADTREDWRLSTSAGSIPITASITIASS